MGVFGERMQREREMRSITLDEIAESTKIGSRMLRALEQEDFDKLPGGIFNKGFVRAYARFLGIDEEQAVADFLTAYLEKQQVKYPANGGGNGLPQSAIIPNLNADSEGEPKEQPDQAAGFMRAAVILIFLLGVGALGWRYFSNRATPSGNVSQQQAAPVVAAPAGSPAGFPAEEKRVVTTKQVERKPTSTPDQSPNQSKDQYKGDTTPASPTDNKVNGATEASSSAADTKITMHIHATQESWVQVTADGKVLMSGVLSANSQRTFRASNEMVVKLGNAAGVEVSYNGKSLPQFPADAKARTLTFTAEGLQQ